MAALRDGKPAQRAELATTLSTLQENFAPSSEVARFIAVVVAWLGGELPTRSVQRGLAPPFRKALRSMIDSVKRAPSAQTDDLVSPHLLAQMVTAVVSATLSSDTATQDKVAIQLVNLEHSLRDQPGGERLRPLIENLRALLGGADPHGLPAVEDGLYGQFWQSAVDLIDHRPKDDADAYQQLLQRLVHNGRFVLRSRDEELIESYLHSLADVRAEAARIGASATVQLVAAIEALLRGEAVDEVEQSLEEPERGAWRAILATRGASTA